MKNRRNIVEQQNPPQNPNDIWLKDGKFYRSTSEGWVAIGSEIKYTNKESMIADKPEGGTIGIDKETGETSIYNDVAEQWSPLSGGGVTSITWLELKDKRDAGKLTPGSLYRITDYQCTTTQENTRSAGHQFDIVLLALSENKLAEEGWAMEHPTDVYDVTFYDGVTKKCYLYCYNVIDDMKQYNIIDTTTLLGVSGVQEENDVANTEIIIDDTNKTATITIVGAYTSDVLETPNLPYNYFQNSNLSAWKVWYCLDNDKTRFAWADDSVDEDVEACINGEYYRNDTNDTTYDGVAYYCWEARNGDFTTKKFTKNAVPQIGDAVYKQKFSRISLIMEEDGVVEEYASGHKGKSIKESIVIDSDVVDKGLVFYNANETETVDGIEYMRFTAKTIASELNVFVNDTEVGSDVYVPNRLPDFNIEAKKIGTIIEHTPEKLAYNGRGIIYRLIDEWNNDVPYDFKNIQFIRPVTDGIYNREGEDTWCYTFSLINAEYGDGVIDASIRDFAWNNYISAATGGTRYLPNNIFLGGDAKYSNYLYDCFGITLNNPYGVILYSTSTNNPDNVNSTSIYINNKKVLTES